MKVVVAAVSLAACLAFGLITTGYTMKDNTEFLLNGQDPASVYFSDHAARELARSAAAGKADEVAALVAKGANPNAVGKETMTPLMWAIFARNAVGVQALLKAGAKPNLHMTNTPSDGRTFTTYPIHLAVRFCQPEILKALIEHKVTLEPDPKSGFSVLMGAAHCFPCFKLLVDHGEDINREVGAGNTAVALAQSSRYYDTVLYGLQRGYNVNLDELNYDIETGGISPDLKPLRAQILALLKTKGVKPWIPPCARGDKPSCKPDLPLEEAEAAKAK
jgi:ankyrin repeat protein